MKFLKNRTVRLGLIENRRFGSSIDVLIEHARRESRSPIVNWTTESLSSDSFKLMALGRFDASLAYPSELSKLRGLQPETRFVSFTLTELRNLQPAKVSCANTVIGHAVIDAINHLPPARRSVNRLQAAYEELLTAEDRRSYRQLVSLERTTEK